MAELYNGPKANLEFDPYVCACSHVPARGSLRRPSGVPCGVSKFLMCYVTWAAALSGQCYVTWAAALSGQCLFICAGL